MGNQRIILILVAAMLIGVGCRKAPAPTAELVAVQGASVPFSPDDSAWRQAPVHQARLMLQDLVEPRLMKPSTQEVRVQAISNGTEIAFRMSWADPVNDDTSGPGSFVDACAVQLPVRTAGEPPAPQMGQGGGTVEITYWRADWQAWMNGRKDDINALYPHAAVDHYPFQAAPLEPHSAAKQEMSDRYAPAQALGNRRSGPRDTAVESLIAEGPGTITKAASNNARGQGSRSPAGWAVVLRRPVPSGLTAGNRTQVAFAVWEGSQGESGARKMRTGWLPLLLEGGGQ